MATRKTAAKKAVKKVTKKAPAKKVASKKTVTKRAYKRKPKAVEVQPEVLTASEAGLVGGTDPDTQQEANSVTLPVVDVTAYPNYDFRNLPKMGRAMFLLELESLGYIFKHTLTPVTETSLLRSETLASIQIVSLNHENKLIDFKLFSDLSYNDGSIAEPVIFSAGMVINRVFVTEAAPLEIHHRGETFKRVSA
ncbi:hypothetical protein [Xanthomonas virus PB119]|nr:hypothetical protein [Xanthomonas virus PB119]